MALNPRDLTVNAMQTFIADKVSYHEIIKKYNFKSDKYFKQVLNKLGYRLLRDQLWVKADKLWIKSDIRTHLTNDEKRLVADLRKQGKSYGDIVFETGIPYHFVYKWADMDAWRKQNAIYKKKTYDSKNKYRASIKSNERPMPPINPPGQVKVIHADSEQIERHLQESLGDKLSPVIGPLSMRRPPMNYTSQDQLS